MPIPRSAKRLVRGCEKFVPALAYLFCPPLPGSCLVRFAYLLADLCTSQMDNMWNAFDKPSRDAEGTVLITDLLEQLEDPKTLRGQRFFFFHVGLGQKKQEPAVEAKKQTLEVSREHTNRKADLVLK